MEKNYSHELFVNDSHGVYIPRVFAQCANREMLNGITKQDWNDLESIDPYGEESELLWDTWDRVLSNATATTADGKEYTLYQDGDLWLVPLWYGEEEWNEYFNFKEVKI